MTEDAASRDTTSTGSGEGSDPTPGTTDTTQELLNVFTMLAAFAAALAVASAV